MTTMASGVFEAQLHGWASYLTLCVTLVICEMGLDTYLGLL